MRKFYLLPAMLFLLASVGRTQEAPHIDIQLEDFQISETAPDHIVFGLHLSVRTQQHIKVTHVAISNAYMNGLPVFLQPADQPVDIPAGEFVQLPGEFKATVYFRDLQSPDPLEKVFQNKSVTVDGEATVTAQLNPMEKLLMLYKTAVSKVTIHTVVPVSIPGGDLGSSAALMVINAARPLFGSASKIAAQTGIGPAPSAWSAETLKTYQNLLLYVVTTYEVKDKQGAITNFTYVGTGFRLDSEHFVVPREAVEPWKFNPDAATRLKSSGSTVVEQATDMVVYSVGEIFDPAQAGHSLRKNDFHLVVEGKQDKKPIIMKIDSGYKKGAMDARAATGNIAVFVFSPVAVVPASAQFAQNSDGIDPMAVLRFKSPQAGAPLEAEVLTESATRNGDQLQLPGAIDSKSFGAPVVVSSGILGMVQDEHVATLLRPALKDAGYTAIK